MTLVRYGAQQVTHLITIAAPHLGTPLAVDGLKVTRSHGPFNVVKKIAGGDAYDAASHSRAHSLPTCFQRVPEPSFFGSIASRIRISVTHR